MIFVTVGAQMPFDRLVRAVDEWAGRTGRDDVFAQIGDTDLVPKHLKWSRLLAPSEFRARLESADLIVSHAGMGTILTALVHDKPILVLPRRGDLRETRNDHQVATAQRLGGRGRIAVALDEAELSARLEDAHELRSSGQIRRWASEELLSTIREFIHR